MSALHAFLAQDDEAISSTVEVLKTTTNHLDILHHPDELVDALAGVPFVAGSVLVVVGLLCVFNGYRWHKWVVAILAFLCGVGLGRTLSDQFGQSNIVAVSLGGLMAIVSTPLLRITVAIFSGLTGAFIGANVWTAVNAESAELHWAGAAMGFIALAMASLLLFRVMIVLFTSVGGAAMVVFGSLVLLLQNEKWEPAIRDSLNSNELVLPVLVSVAAVAGFVLQEGRTRQQQRQQQAQQPQAAHGKK